MEVVSRANYMKLISKGFKRVGFAQLDKYTSLTDLENRILLLNRRYKDYKNKESKITKLDKVYFEYTADGVDIIKESIIGRTYAIYVEDIIYILKYYDTKNIVSIKVVYNNPHIKN